MRSCGFVACTLESLPIANWVLVALYVLGNEINLVSFVSLKIKLTHDTHDATPIMFVSQTDIDVAPHAMEIGLLVLARFGPCGNESPNWRG